MATTTLDPISEEHTDDDWVAIISGVPGGDRVANITDDSDTSYIGETTPDTDTITYTYEAAPAGSTVSQIVANVRAIQAQSETAEIKIAGDLLINGVSQGVAYTDLLTLNVITDETITWTGLSLSKAQMDQMTIMYYGTGHSPCSCAIVEKYLTITYNLGYLFNRDYLAGGMSGQHIGGVRS